MVAPIVNEPPEFIVVEATVILAKVEVEINEPLGITTSLLAPGITPPTQVEVAFQLNVPTLAVIVVVEVRVPLLVIVPLRTKLEFFTNTPPLFIVSEFTVSLAVNATVEPLGIITAS